MIYKTPTVLVVLKFELRALHMRGIATISDITPSPTLYALVIFHIFAQSSLSIHDPSTYPHDLAGNVAVPHHT
jgi:predicted permease